MRNTHSPNSPKSGTAAEDAYARRPLTGVGRDWIQRTDRNAAHDRNFAGLRAREKLSNFDDIGYNLGLS